MDKQTDKYKVVYFNAWKYAGFMEIVPSLIYKILREGNYPKRDIGQTIATIMISLGKQYSDRVGEWVEKRIGVDPKEMYKDINKAIRTLGNDGFLPNAVIEKYYTQIDQAQDPFWRRYFLTEDAIQLFLLMN